MRLKCIRAIQRSTVWVAACVGSAALFACSTPRQPMPHELVSQLKLGTTTMDQAETTLGAPEETESLPDGGEVWVYVFAPDPVPAPLGLPAPTDAHRTSEVLRLVFAPTGLLKSHEATRSILKAGADPAEVQAERQALRDISLPR